MIPLLATAALASSGSPGLALPAPIDQVAISPFERRDDALTPTVVLDRATLEVDTYPTVVGLRAHVELNGQVFGRWVGLPLSTPEIPLLPPRDLSIQVNDQEAEWELLTRWICEEDGQKRIVLDDDPCAGTAIPGYWATVYLPEERVKHAVLTWSAWQLVPFTEATVQVIHGTGGTWAGPIDRLETRVELHQVHGDEVREEIRAKIPREGTGPQVAYTVDEDVLRTRQVTSTWQRTSPAVGGEATLVSYVTRFFATPEPPSQEDWETLMGILQHAVLDDDPEVRGQARGFLADLRRWVSEHCDRIECTEAQRRHGMELFTPAGEAASDVSDPLPSAEETDTVEGRRAAEERFRLQIRRVHLEEIPKHEDLASVSLEPLLVIPYGRPPSTFDRMRGWLWPFLGLLLVGIGVIWTIRRRRAPEA